MQQSLRLEKESGVEGTTSGSGGVKASGVVGGTVGERIRRERKTKEGEDTEKQRKAGEGRRKER